MKLISGQWVAGCILLAAVGTNAFEIKNASVKEPQYKSSCPLYFSVVFSEKNSKRMLVVMDESKGDGKGYDLAYVDENRDGDLKNAASKDMQPSHDIISINFSGPFLRGEGTANTAKYSITLNGLNKVSKNITSLKSFYFCWNITTSDNWYYFSSMVDLTSTIQPQKLSKGSPLYWPATLNGGYLPRIRI